jgi:hypothetical protein
MLGIDHDTWVGYYEDVARNTNIYAFGVKEQGRNPRTCLLSDQC